MQGRWPAARRPLKLVKKAFRRDERFASPSSLRTDSIARRKRWSMAALCSSLIAERMRPCSAVSTVRMMREICVPVPIEPRLP
jgi:hypothetical protein